MSIGWLIPLDGNVGLDLRPGPLMRIITSTISYYAVKLG